MPKQTKQEKYVEYLNENILPHIDFGHLQASYDGDRKYAKKVLFAMHNAVEKCYGKSSFDYGDCQDSKGFITLPGIVSGIYTGKIAVVLLHIDLYSSGEHYGTDFLLDAGVVEQSPGNKALADRISRDFIPYDYCYTPRVRNDHHVDYIALPKDLKEMLETIRGSGQKQTKQQDSPWPRFETAKHKTTEKKAAPPQKAPNKNSKKEI